MSPREKLLTELDQLNEDQINQVLVYVETLQTDEPKNEYDPEDDPIVGMFSGPADLSIHAKKILHEEIDASSGWTQKKEDD